MLEKEDVKRAMKLKKIGFFKELDHGLGDGESLKDNILDRPQAYEDKIINYLKNGIIYCNSPGLIMDALDENDKVIGNLNILTDVEWLWTSDLSYYVEQYHVKVNEDFVEHMKKSNWTMINLEEINLVQLEL